VYFEGSHRYYAENKTPLFLPITLKDNRFRYYNLSALRHNSSQSEYRSKDYWPDTDDDEDEEVEAIQTDDEHEESDTDS
jgi:hypothetical protein